TAIRPRPATVDPELRALIDRELDRLPAAPRTAIILCDVEGLTRSEAAARLGWAEGTVASRLARGRQVLAPRLIRAGLVATSGLAAAAGSDVAAGLIESIIGVGLGRTPASPAIQALTHGVIHAMSVKRYAVTLAVGLTAIGLTLTVREVL